MFLVFCPLLIVTTVPACRKNGLAGLKANLIQGFCNRATHNLWVLLEENQETQKRIDDETYPSWYQSHLDNSTYFPLIRQLVEGREWKSQSKLEKTRKQNKS